MSKIGESISEALQRFEEDYGKFESGNNAAGTRARIALMEIKKLADSGRKEISNAKEKRKESA